MTDDPRGEVRPLDAGDLDVLLRLRRASFGRPGARTDDEMRTIMTRRLPYLRGYSAGDAVVAAAAWYPFPAWIGGRNVPTGALAAVVSAPEARRRGHVRTLIEAGLSELRSAGVGWAGEHPFDPRFYDAFGFRTVPSSTWLELPFDRLPGRALDVDFGEVAPGDPELRAIRTAFASLRSFTLHRDEPDGFVPNEHGLPGRWADLFEAPAAEATDGAAYRCEGGYALVATEGFGSDGILHVVDMAWRDPAARARVLAMLRAWEGQLGTVRLEVPVDDPLARRDASDWARHREPLQMRVVDLVTALESLRAPAGGAGEAVLDVDDELAPWNRGRWHIVTDATGCTVRASDRPADAWTDIGGVTALLAGTPPAALLASGEARGSIEALRTVQSLTSDHPPFLGLADYY